MKNTLTFLLLTALLALPTLVPAMDHGAMHHGDMKMETSTIMLAPQTVDGVTANVHLKDVKATMAKMGMKHTHHFMLNLTESKGGKAIEPQLAAVKITSPNGKSSAPVELMAMEGHAGGDLILADPGPYNFAVGVKLADGRKIQYSFSSTIK